MTDNMTQMKAYLARFQSGDWVGACEEFCHPDFELHEPPGLPQSGVHRGALAPIDVTNTYRGIWDVEIGEQELWAARDADIVFSRYEITWTSKQTGRSMTQRIVELNHFRDGKLARMDVYMSDPAGLMATLDGD